MKERPILFNSEMVRAILAGRKTQTRRVIKPQPSNTDPDYVRGLCPYGQPGDLLWVRETWCNGYDGYRYRADNLMPIYKWRPSIHMPRKASRITLEVTSVHVERVQDISEDDVEAEGIHGFDGWPSPRGRFGYLWDSINAKRGFGWNKNPWVWVVGLKLLPATDTPKGE